MDRRMLLLGGAAIAGVGGLAAYQNFAGNGTRGGGVSSAGLSDSALMEEGPLGDLFIGNADAPVTIIEYASLTCGHCAAFHNNTLPAIKSEFIDTGKARLIMREFPLGNEALLAAMVARCAGDKLYFPLTDALLSLQQSWAYDPNPQAAVFRVAQQAGFTQDSFRACLNNQAVLDGIRWVRDRAETEFGVESTPTFFINGEMLRGNHPLQTFRERINAAMTA